MATRLLQIIDTNWIIKTNSFNSNKMWKSLFVKIYKHSKSSQHIGWLGLEQYIKFSTRGQWEVYWSFVWSNAGRKKNKKGFGEKYFFFVLEHVSRFILRLSVLTVSLDKDFFVFQI